MTITVNRKALLDGLALTIEKIRELKKRRSQSGQPNWLGGEYFGFYRLKDLATNYCTILAHKHGKLHLKSTKTLEAQENKLEKLWDKNQAFWQMYYVFTAEPVPVIPTVEYHA